MAIIKNNPLLKGITGMLGDLLYYRNVNGKLIVSVRPRKRDVTTAHQQYSASRFRRASQYAKNVIAQPDLKLKHSSFIDHRLTSAYTVALADALKDPDISEVCLHHYHRMAGDTILITVTDYYPAARVSIEIRSSSNDLLENGNAILRADTVNRWIYTTTSPMQSAAETIIVTAEDHAQNISTRQITIAN